MSSQAVMKRQILALAKREPSNEELQKIKQSLAVYKKLTNEEQSKINEMVKDAHAKLESEGKFAKGGEVINLNYEEVDFPTENQTERSAKKWLNELIKERGRKEAERIVRYNLTGKNKLYQYNNVYDTWLASATNNPKFAKGGTTKTQSLKTALTDLKNKVGVKKFKRATTGTDIKKDIAIPALKGGKRIVRTKGKTTNQYGTFKNQVGTTYYESRANRSDVNQPSEKRKIKLADGGSIGNKVYNEMYGVGKSKYVVNFHDGEKTHKDGSPFFDMRIFKNKIEKNKFVKDLKSKGFVYKYGEGGVIEIGEIVNLPEIKMRDGKIQFEKVTNGEVIGFEDGIYEVLNPKTNRVHRVSENQIEKITDYSKHREQMSGLRDDENTYPKGTEFADGGKLRSKAKYIPNRNIDEIEVTRNGKTTSIDGANLLDGVYLKKGTKFADGGLMTFSKSVNESTIDELQGKYGGVTIKKMGDLLEQMFPYSFGFELFEVKDIKQQRTLVPTEMKGIKDDSLKIYFDKFHSMTFRVFQGGENTYFYFGLTSEDKEYIGTFGFKDDGDVESEYVTSFIAFLCKMYGFPFQVNHSVYAQGGTIKKSLAEFKNKVGASKYREATRGVDIKADLQIPALKKGRRVVTTKGKTSNQYGTFKNKVGSVYYENRPNHYDVNQPSEKRKIKLADGGQVMFVKNFTGKDGIEISEGKTTDGKTFYTANVISGALQKIIPMNENKNYVINRAKAIYKSMLEFKKTDDYRIYYGKDAKYAQGGTFADGGVLEGAKIYVADLAEYNDGRLVGKWFDLSDYSDASELMVAIQEMLDDQTAKDKHGEVHEEWAVHDFEGFPRSFYSEYMGEKDFEKLYQIAEVANDRGLPIDVLMEAVAYFGADEDIERVAEAYYSSVRPSYGGEWRSFAMDMVDELGIEGINDAEYYFDYDSFGSDARTDYTDEELEEYGYDELDDTELGERLVDDMGGFDQLGKETIEGYFDYDKFGDALEYDFISVKGDDGDYYFFNRNW